MKRRYFDIVLRLLWGGHFVVFGFNKLFVFQKILASNPFSQQVIDHFYESGYLMQTVGITQILTGSCILLNRFFPLAILVAFPIVLNIVLFTIFTSDYSVSAIATGGMVFFSNCYFLYQNREKYYPLLHNRVPR